MNRLSLGGHLTPDGFPLEGGRGDKTVGNIPLLNLFHFISMGKKDQEQRSAAVLEIAEVETGDYLSLSFSFSKLFCGIKGCKVKAFWNINSIYVLFALGRWWKGKSHMTPAASSGCVSSPKIPWTS